MAASDPPSRPESSDESSSVRDARTRCAADLDATLSLESDSAAPGGLIEKLRSGAPRGTRYLLQGEIARGGMGAILRIWDDELRRTLAMKVALQRDGARETDPRSIGRFLEEAQVTGQLDHPGIVPVHELGLGAEGGLYFTMRLVKGEDLARIFEHVRERREGWTQLRAVGVLLRVCEAMSYAHSKGVIHRDLKPANVMVGKFGEVYVMDWGLARVLGREDRHDLRIQDGTASALTTFRTELREGGSADSPLVTLDGDVVGTPSFMAPEQARGELDRIGASSDVYSVGAMLYALLAGELPFVQSGERQDARSVLAAVLAGPPRPLFELAPAAPAELLAIVDKAMARDPRQRYASMQELGEELRAFSEGRVVRAYETGAWAETRNWVRRNKPLAASLAAVLLVAVAGAIAFAGQADKAARALVVAQREEAQARTSEKAALQARSRAEHVTELVQRALIGSDPLQEGQQGFLVVDAMDQAIRELESGALAQDPETEADLRSTIATVLIGNSRPEEALRLASAALETRRKLYSGDHERLAIALGHVAQCLHAAGRIDEGLRMHESCVAMLRRLHPGDDAQLAANQNELALDLLSAGRPAEALPNLQEALAMGRRLGTDDATLLAILKNLASCLSALDRDGEALGVAEESLAISERLHPGDHVATAKILNGIGVYLGALVRQEEGLAKLEEALAMRQRLLHGDHIDLAESLHNVAAAKRGLRRDAEALPLLVAALEMRQRIYAGDHPDVATSLASLATCRNMLGEAAQALQLATSALEMRERLFTGDHPAVASSLHDVALILRGMGRNAEAAPKFEESLAMSRRLPHLDEYQLASSLDAYAFCLFQLGRNEAALPAVQEALAIRERLLPGDHADVATSLDGVGACLASLGKLDEALAKQQASLEMRRRLFTGDHAAVATSASHVGVTLQRLEHAAAALPYFEEALAMRERLFPEDQVTVALSLGNLAHCLQALDRGSEALSHAERGNAMAERLFPPGHATRTALAKTLADIKEAQR